EACRRRIWCNSTGVRSARRRRGSVPPQPGVPARAAALGWGLILLRPGWPAPDARAPWLVPGGFTLRAAGPGGPAGRPPALLARCGRASQPGRRAHPGYTGRGGGAARRNRPGHCRAARQVPPGISPEPR
nr:hypothetical protein [Tanacetum cinerariifolium]